MALSTKDFFSKFWRIRLKSFTLAHFTYNISCKNSKNKENQPVENKTYTITFITNES